MKKKYINPNIEVVMIATQQMIATSNPEDGLKSGGKGSLGGEIKSGALSREYDFFDED